MNIRVRLTLIIGSIFNLKVFLQKKKLSVRQNLGNTCKNLKNYLVVFSKETLDR